MREGGRVGGREGGREGQDGRETGREEEANSANMDNRDDGNFWLATLVVGDTREDRREKCL